MRVFLAGVLLTSCAYKPSSFESDVQPFPGHRATAGCLDLAIERRADRPSGNAVLAYAFGNRCDQPVIVDLAAAAVVARTAEGDTRALSPYDPRREIEARWLDSRAVGREALVYERSGAALEICVEAGSIARAPTMQWLCFASQP